MTASACSEATHSDRLRVLNDTKRANRTCYVMSNAFTHDRPVPDLHPTTSSNGPRGRFCMTRRTEMSAESSGSATENPYAPPSGLINEDVPTASIVDSSRNWALMPAALGVVAASTGMMMIIASMSGLIPLGTAGHAFFALLTSSAVPFAAASRSYWNGNRRRGMITMAIVPIAIIPALCAVIYLET